MPLRLVAPLAVIVFAAAALAVGCGDTSIETEGSRTGTVTSVTPVPQRSSKAPTGASAKSCDSYATDAGALRATGIGCDQARQVMYRWQRERSCALPSGASRGGCRTSSYRCQAVRTDRGTAVACARPSRSIAFVAKRG